MGLGDDDQCIEDDFTAWYVIIQVDMNILDQHSISMLMFQAILLPYDLYFRKEELWPALDQLLRDEDDATVATPYTASVLEYRVVIRDQLDATVDEKKQLNGNGHAVVDAHHPVRCSI